MVQTRTITVRSVRGFAAERDWICTVAMPDERILGLSEDSAIESWTDDKGKNLLQEAAPPADDMGMGQVVSRVINNIRHDRVSVNREGDAILVTAVTAARPSKGAGALSRR